MAKHLICGECSGNEEHFTYEIIKQTKDELVLECINCGDRTRFLLKPGNNPLLFTTDELELL